MDPEFDAEFADTAGITEPRPPGPATAREIGLPNES
jgi:hypothetical protein